jgi:uracil-DNA glycosylase
MWTNIVYFRVFVPFAFCFQAKEALIDTRKHTVLKAAHPSGLSASRGFFGCKHFSLANEAIQKAGGVPIDWQIDL